MNKDIITLLSFNSKEAYTSYEKEMIRLQKENTLNIRSQIGRATNDVCVLSSEIEIVSKNLAKETDEDVKQAQKDELRNLKQSLVARQDDPGGLA